MMLKLTALVSALAVAVGAAVATGAHVPATLSYSMGCNIAYGSEESAAANGCKLSSASITAPAGTLPPARRPWVAVVIKLQSVVSATSLLSL